MFDGSRRLLLLEQYNSANPSLADRYRGTVTVLYYKFRDSPVMNDCIFRSMGCTFSLFSKLEIHTSSFPEIVCAAFHHNEEEGHLAHEVTLQSKLEVLSAWFHDGTITQRSGLLAAYNSMTLQERYGGRGSQKGYGEMIVTCSMVIGKAAAAEMAKLWPTTSITTSYFRLPWSKLATDVPRQVRVLLIVLTH